MSAVIKTKIEEQGVILSFNPDYCWEEITSALAEHLQEGAQFYQGSKLYFDLAFKDWRAEELQNLINLIESNILPETDFYFMNQSSGVERDNKATPKEQPFSPRSAQENKYTKTAGNDTKLIQRTLRSGQSIEHMANLVLLGDVNPGAEIKAGGDIIVFGKLMGLVHAGATGDKGAAITALQLAPTQIRIASVISRSPDEDKSKELRPERAYIKNNRIVVEEVNL